MIFAQVAGRASVLNSIKFYENAAIKLFTFQYLYTYVTYIYIYIHTYSILQESGMPHVCFRKGQGVWHIDFYDNGPSGWVDVGC